MNRPREADLCMTTEEYFRAPETYVASHELNLGDGGSVLSLLYEAYSDENRIVDEQIKADFRELYQALHGMPCGKWTGLSIPSVPSAVIMSGMALFMECRWEFDWHRKKSLPNDTYRMPRLAFEPRHVII